MSNLLEVKDKVQRHLVELVGDIQLLPDGRFAFNFHSTRLFIRVSESDNQDATFVVLTAPIVIGAPTSPALFEWVARETGQYLFGHIECSFNDDEPNVATLVFSHTLLGDFLDAEELRRAVIAVVNTADDLDEDVVARFGGKRFEDS